MSRNTDQLLAEIAALEGKLSVRDSEVERLKLIIAKMQRQLFGRRAESHPVSPDQLNLGWQHESRVTETISPSRPETPSQSRPPVRKSLPDHLPRDIEIHNAGEHGCPDCGGELRRIGEDVSEVLEYVPERFRVKRHVRPKLACACCKTLVQAEAPERPIARGTAGPGLLAHVLVSTYCDHIPL